MTGHEIRKSFLDFFGERGHRLVRSSSLVPHGDPTLLFTNAGMNQFKDVFLGLEQRDYQRAASAQKCLRAGGKHNDLENVGRTLRHHTFFEMLGNFSFGDYFKRDAVAYAWELLTQVWKLPKDKLYITVFREDDEAAGIWQKEIGLPAGRVHRLGEDDNFWAMGDTGPCGPCSEIQYDFGPAASELGHKDCKFPCDCGRYVELWNLVFMQFNRICDKYDPNDSTKCVESHIEPLPKPCVDTGAGLERLAAALQGKVSNYDTDLFRPLISRAAEMANTSYGSEPRNDMALRIIADHSRAAAFLVTDGVLPSNEGRGYVLRKILRRAIDHGRRLGLERPFLFEMVGQVAELMRAPYPEVLESIQRVATVVKGEEEKYSRLVVPAVAQLTQAALAKHFRQLQKTAEEFSQRVLEPLQKLGSQLAIQQQKQFEPLHRAIQQFNQQVLEPLQKLGSQLAIQQQKQFEPLHRAIQQFNQQVSESLQKLGSQLAIQQQKQFEQKIRELVDRLSERPVISGKDLFYAYDSLGLRPDFIRDLAGERGWEIAKDADAEFQVELEKQRERAKASWKAIEKAMAKEAYARLSREHTSEFVGHETLVVHRCRIVEIFHPGLQRFVEEATIKDPEVEIVLDRTPFYAEAGGQVGDTGWLSIDSEIIARVEGTYHPVMNVIAHRVRMGSQRRPRRGDLVTAEVDREPREATMRNHTGTHLLHAALRAVLGPHVKQSGSLVAPDRLRFDFTHYAPLDPEELAEIERRANEHILSDTEVKPDVMDLDEALKSGALAFFGDKYPEKNVRVITIGDFSKELCGGTHVRHTGQIGLLKLTSESSIAAGIRRVEAITGSTALEQYQRALDRLQQVSALLKTADEELVEALERLLAQARSNEKQVESLHRKLAHSQVDELAQRVRRVKDVPVLVAQLEAVDRATLRNLVDSLRQKLGSAVIVLGTSSDGKVALIAAVTKDLTPRLHAGKIAQQVAGWVGGTGGGRAELAEAGGKDAAQLPRALEEVYAIVEKML